MENPRLLRMSPPADIDLAELEVVGGVVVGELGEDVGEVDAGGGPRGVERDQPRHLNNKGMKG